MRATSGLFCRIHPQILQGTRLFLPVLRCTLRLRRAPEFLRPVLSLFSCGEENQSQYDAVLIAYEHKA